MATVHYVIIYQHYLFSTQAEIPGDTVAVPPAASLVNEDDWGCMCDAAGTEENLISELGIIADYRTE